MANVHNTFLEFNQKIGSSPKKRKTLKNMRSAIKADIKQYFNANGDCYEIRFKEQGCFSAQTTILPTDGEYDVGVYIFGKEINRPTSEKAHRWVLSALEHREAQNAVDKKTCVRVEHAEGYHIDIRIYYLSTENNVESFLHSSGIPKLAHKTKGWIEGELFASKLWFEKVLRGKSQLKRIIRYLKAWSNNNAHLELPNGIVMTVIALNNYEYHDRDDKAFLQTLKNIQEEIDGTRSIWGFYNCRRPNSDRKENLLSNYSSAKRKWNFLNALDNMIVSGERAVEHESETEAYEIWQKHLGSKFMCADKEERQELHPQSFSMSLATG